MGPELDQWTVPSSISCCGDGRLYTGSTRRSVGERVCEHNAGLVDSYKSVRRPVALIHSEGYLRSDEAVATERRSRAARENRLAYVHGDFDAIHRVAKGRPKKKEGVAASFDTAAPRPAQDEVR